MAVVFVVDDVAADVAADVEAAAGTLARTRTRQYRHPVVVVDEHSLLIFA